MDVALQSDLSRFKTRDVVGTWLLLGMPMKVTRSIESTEGGFFLVTRWTDPDDGSKQGGNLGFPLFKLSERVFQYENNSECRAVISPEGFLSMVISTDTTIHGEPCVELWP